VPREVVAPANLVLLDTLGEALAASRLAHPTPQGLVAYALASGGREEASLIGQGQRTSLANAAMVNAALAAFGLRDPLHLSASSHAPAIMAAVALATAERAGADGPRLLGGFILGTEVACRVAAALDPAAMQARGFHPTAIGGVFGAAAAAGHVLGLGRHQLAAALGLALQQASGLAAWVSDPSESARPLSPGFAARNGVTAALLASLALGGPPAPFDGRYNAFAAFSGAGRAATLLDHWGERFYVAEMTHKLHASCSYTHAAIDALIELRALHDLHPDEVRAVVVHVAPSARAVTSDPGLRSCHAPYVLALALARGQVAIEDILAERGGEPGIARLMACIEMVEKPEMESGYPERCAALVEIATADGRILARRVDAARGTAEDPLTPAAIRDKFQRAPETSVSPAQAAEIAALVGRLEQLEHLDALLSKLRQPAAIA
jgi:2-methylcitrate dehydratase PrpD